MSNYEILNNEGMLKDAEGNEIWWTEVFHDKAYDIVKDRKFPILIPSYNNPNPPAVQGFLSKMDEEYNYPIFLFVRDSQKEAYEAANKHPYVTVVSAPDDMIDSAGKARRWSLKWLYQQGYEYAFSFDDDACDLMFTNRGFTGKGDPKSKVVGDANISKILAMWQISMETADKRFGIGISGVYPCGFGWKEEYCQLDGSILLYRGNINQVVCLNVKKLIENGITYDCNRIAGHEDIDLIIKCLEKNIPVCTFPFINYTTPPMDCANFGCFGNTMQDRFKAQQKLMIDRYGEDYPYLTFREKRGLDQCVINFRRYRKDKNIDQYVYNLFEDCINN